MDDLCLQLVCSGYFENIAPGMYSDWEHGRRYFWVCAVPAIVPHLAFQSSCLLSDGPYTWAAFSGSVYAMPMSWPLCSLRGDWEAIFPAHSPSIAQAWVQSNGVLALQPNRGVRSRPPRRASVGSSGTAAVAKKLFRLWRSSSIHSSGVLGLIGSAMRLDLGARASQSAELDAVAVDAGGMSISGVCLGNGTSGAISTSSC